MEGTSAYIIIINATFGWIICQELTNWSKSVHFWHFRTLYNALKMGQCDVKIQKNFATNLATAQNRRCLGLLHHMTSVGPLKPTTKVVGITLF